MMQADVVLGDGDHHALGQLLPNLGENLLNQHSNLGTPQTFAAYPDHRRGALATHGQ
jgi:hypothetical protein